MTRINNITINSGSFGVELILKKIDKNFLKDALEKNQLARRFICSLSFGETANHSRTLLPLVITAGSPRSMRLGSKGGHITGRLGEDFSVDDIVVASEYLLERMRQIAGKYSIHSSSIYRGNSAVLLIANMTGAGKTALILYLNGRHGFELYSDEKAIIEPATFSLAGQTTSIFPEEKTRRLLRQFRLNLPKKILIDQTETKGVALCIVPVIVGGLNQDAEVFKYSIDQLRWMLYEEVSKDIKLLNGFGFGMQHPLMSLDNSKIAQKRLNEVTKFAKRVPCYAVRGSLFGVAQAIVQLFDKISPRTSASTAK